MKISLLALCLFFIGFANAQIIKGSVTVGGDLYLSKGDAKSERPGRSNYAASSLGFSPSFGIAVKENVFMGARLLASSYNNSYKVAGQNTEYSNQKRQSFGGGIWTRKYFPLAKSFYFFGDAGLNGSSLSEKTNDNITTPQFRSSIEKGYYINAAFYPGVAYNIRKALFLEVALNNLVAISYQHSNKDFYDQGSFTGKETYNNYSLSSSLSNGVSLQVGVKWIFNKK